MKNLITMALTVILYVASGQNKMGERVLAEIVDQDQNGTVSGVVYDRLARTNYPVFFEDRVTEELWEKESTKG